MIAMSLPEMVAVPFECTPLAAAVHKETAALLYEHG
jgi:hypothetical protein